MKARFLLELPLRLERNAPRPLAAQLESQLRAAVEDGTLAGGTPLPSSRELARQLGISRGVVSTVYEQLASGGYLEARPRSVPRVRPVPAAGAAAPPAARAPRFDFSAMAPDVSLFPRREWQRSLEYALSSGSDSVLDYAPGEGLVELRTELAAYLGRVRGVRVEPECLLVTQGFTQALEVISRVLERRGASHMMVENPSYPSRITRRCGLERSALPVDGDGALVELLSTRPTDAILLTPAHQFPMGGVLSPARRRLVTEWARERGTFVIEDDYTAEYRFGHESLGALQPLAPDRVAYIGSASKTLAPGLRIGWLVVPEELVEDARAEKNLADAGSPGLDQLAYARFLQSGAMDEHLRRTRRIYGRRRRRFVAEVERCLGDVTIAGAPAGLHVVALLRRRVDMAGFLAACAAERIAVRDIDSFACAPHEHGQGLVLGYGRMGEETSAAALRRMGALLQAYQVT